MKSFISTIYVFLFLFYKPSFSQDTIPFISLGNDTTLCIGEYAILSAYLPQTCHPQYSWNDGSATSEKNITKPGTYWINVVSDCGTFNDTIHIDYEACKPECYSPNSVSGIYTTPKSDVRGKCLVSTLGNDGFYVAGMKDYDVLLSKLDLSGNIIWTRTFEILPGGKHYVNAMTIDEKGILAIAGTFILDFAGTATTFLMRYDPNSDEILWTKEYIIEVHSDCLSMIQNPSNDHYLLSLRTDDYINAVGGGTLIEIDNETGEIVNLFAKKDAIFHDMIMSGDNLYLAGGYKFDSENFTRQSLTKINWDNGVIQWSKIGEAYAQVGADYAPDLVLSGNNIYSIYSDENRRLHIQKMTNNGNVIWIKQYEIEGRFVYANEIISSENGFIIFAQVYDTQEWILFKINSDGQVLWSKAYYTLTNYFSFGANNAVNQVLEFANEIMFTGYSVDSQNLHQPVYPIMIIGRTNLTGNILSSCIQQRDLNIEVATVQNPTFISFIPPDFNFNKQTISVDPIKTEPNLYVRESCPRYDSIFTYNSVSLCKGESYEGYSDPGIFLDTFTTTYGCDSIRTLIVTRKSPVQTSLEISICSGDSFEGYDVSGIYIDTFNLLSGCDSIRTLRLKVIHCKPIVSYSLDACESNMANGSQMDYSEFIPSYPTIIPCADISADNLYRSPPQENKHSCTPGINSSSAMCVTILDSCDYIPGHPASVIVEVQIDPEQDSLVQLTGFGFYEKGPVSYNWINGPSGPNNYPLYYGIRVLKNGTVVFMKAGIPTSDDWNFQKFDFFNNDSFAINVPTTLRIELLPYCPVGNGAQVAAWDIDEITLFGGCLPKIVPQPLIVGSVKTNKGYPVKRTEMRLANESSFTDYDSQITNDLGEYRFMPLERNLSYFIMGYNNSDLLNGVSTLDLIYIQRHLLGIKPFTSLYQYIAADINHSNDVSVLDLLDLRKALLHIENGFPNNTSWRFGVLPQDVNSTSFSNFKEESFFENLNNDTLLANFTGIKIGDLNEDFNPIVSDSKTGNRSKTTVNFCVQDQDIKAGHLFTVPIRLNKNFNIVGMQFAFDLKDISFNTIKGGIIPIKKENYSIVDGIFRMSWSSDGEVSITSDDILISLELVSSYDGRLSEILDQLDQQLPPELYLSDLEKLDLDLKVLPSPVSENVLKMEIEPSILSTEASVSFTMLKEGLAELRFFDVAGRILYDIKKSYGIGRQIEKIRKENFLVKSGVVYCQLISNGFSDVNKFILAY